MYYLLTFALLVAMHFGLLRLRNIRFHKRCSAEFEPVSPSHIVFFHRRRFEWLEKFGWWYYDHTAGLINNPNLWSTVPVLAYNENNGVAFVCLFRDYQRSSQLYERIGRKYYFATPCIRKVIRGIAYANSSHPAYAKGYAVYKGEIESSLASKNCILIRAPNLYVPFGHAWQMEKDSEVFPVKQYPEIKKYLLNKGRGKLENVRELIGLQYI